MARKIFEKDPKLCLKQNYNGETVFHIAIRDHKSLDMLNIFESEKFGSLLLKDVRGENPLFYAVRSGEAPLYNYFYSGGLSGPTKKGGPSSTDFFKARGEQNYEG